MDPSPSNSNTNNNGAGTQPTETNNAEAQPQMVEVTAGGGGGGVAGNAILMEHPPHAGESFFTVDGMHYNIGNGENGAFLMQDFNGIFSTDDLYAVIDPSNPNSGNVTEIDDCWPGSNFIPVGNSDLRQLHDESSGASNPNNNSSGPAVPASSNDSSASARAVVEESSESGGGGTASSTGGGAMAFSNGAFYKLLMRTNDTNNSSAIQQQQQQQQQSQQGTTSSPSVETLSVSSNSLDSYASQDAPHGVDDINSPSKNSVLSQTSSADGVQGQQKIRKPRGRKPKHVKEAEAAAAAAMASKNGTLHAEAQAQNAKTASGPMHNGQGPTMVSTSVRASEHGAGACQNAGGQMQMEQRNLNTRQNRAPPYVTIHHYAQPAAATSRQDVDQGHQEVQNQPHSHQQPYQTMAQLANQQDPRRVLMAARRINAVPPTAFLSRSIPGPIQLPYPGTNAPYQSYQMQQQQQPPPQQFQRQAPQPPSHPSQTAQQQQQQQHPPPYPHYGQPMTNAAGGSGRLDQLFSSRIAAPSNKTLVKPNIIQENRSIYNLLTAPTMPRPGGGLTFDNRKLSQERWTQMPNPVVNPDGNEDSRAASGGSLASDGASTQHHQQQQITKGLPSLYGNTQPGPPPPPSVHMIGGLHNRVNIRRDNHHEGRHASFVAPSSTNIRIGPNGSSASSLSIPGGSNYPHSHHNSRHQTDYGPTSEHYTELQHRYESIVQDNYHLRCTNLYLRRKVKLQMVELKHSYEQNESLKTRLQERSVFSDRNFRGTGLGSPERSFMDESCGLSTGGDNVNLDLFGEEGDDLGWRRGNIGYSGRNENFGVGGGGGSVDDDASSTTAISGTPGTRGFKRRLETAAEGTAAGAKKASERGGGVGGGGNGEPTLVAVDSSSGERGGNGKDVTNTAATKTTATLALVDVSSIKMEANEGQGGGDSDATTDHLSPTFDGDNTSSTVFHSPIDATGSRRVTSSTPGNLPMRFPGLDYTSFSSIAYTPTKNTTVTATASKSANNGNTGSVEPKSNQPDKENSKGIAAAGEVEPPDGTNQSNAGGNGNNDGNIK